MNAMYEAIKNFAKQFAYEPVIENGTHLEPFERFVAVGMGGSGLAAGLLKAWNPLIRMKIHRDYGLPDLPEEALKKSLIILSSYSGNTEEVIEAFYATREKKLNSAVIAVGGKLLGLAKDAGIPYIQLPDTGIQPRSARGYSFQALLKMTGQELALRETRMLVDTLMPERYEDEGRALAEYLKDFVPIIYSSRRNVAIAYNWKITFNETGKIPAFYNVFPELNHNEMAGFDAKKLAKSFHFIFLRDHADHPKIQRRMEILEGLYRDRGLHVEIAEMHGDTPFHKIFSTLLVADWAAYYTAKIYGFESDKMKIVEEFKRLI